MKSENEIAVMESKPRKVTKSFSVTEQVWEKALERAKADHRHPSNYIEKLIIEDLERGQVEPVN